MRKFLHIFFVTVVSVITIMCTSKPSDQTNVDSASIDSEETAVSRDSTIYSGSGLVRDYLLGSGYNTITNNFCDQCIKFNPDNAKSEIITSKAPKITYKFELIESTSELKSALDISTSASFKYGSAKGSGSYAFYSSNGISQYSNYIFINERVVTGTATIKRPVLDNGLENLSKTSFPDFVTKCGNSYLHGIELGGSLNVIVEIKSSSSEEYRATKASLSASMNGLVAKASASGNLSSALSEIKGHTNIKVNIIRQGGVDVLPSLDSLSNYSLKFNQYVIKNPTIIDQYFHSYSSLLGVKVAQNFKKLDKLTRALGIMSPVLDQCMENRWSLSHIRNNSEQYPDSISDKYLGWWQQNESHILRLQDIADSLENVYIENNNIGIPPLPKPLSINLTRLAKTVKAGSISTQTSPEYISYDFAKGGIQLVGSIPAGVRGGRITALGKVGTSHSGRCESFLNPASANGRGSGIFPVISVIVKERGSEVRLLEYILNSSVNDIPESNVDVFISVNGLHDVQRNSYPEGVDWKPFPLNHGYYVACSDPNEILRAIVRPY